MRNQGKNTKYFFAIVGIGTLVMLILGFNNRINTLRRLTDEAEDVQAEVARLEATKASLEAEIAYANTDAAVEAWAYEQARMIREGDYLIAPIPASEGTAANPQPAVVLPEPEPVQNWQIWKALFFDPVLP
jgi:cell division protein FtsB